MIVYLNGERVLPRKKGDLHLFTYPVLLLLLGCSSSRMGLIDVNSIPIASSGLGSSNKEPNLGVLRLESARPADSFVDSVGVVTHLSYDDTPYYTQWPQIFTLLRSSGIRHIRDGYHDWESSSAFVKEHEALASAGIHTTYVIPFDAKTRPEAIQRFSRKVKDLEAIEAPNECNAAQNCGGGGKQGVANAASFQTVLMAAGRLLHVPVIGPSFTSQEAYADVGDLSSKMTSNNLHMYFGGRNPGSRGWGAGDTQGHNYGSIDWWLDQGRLDGGSMPSYITETGYMMPRVSRPFTIPPALGASYVPRTLLLAFNKKVSRTFIYELLDEVSSPDYGMLAADLSPKPAFTAVSSLLHLLADPGPRFTPGSLAYRVHADDAELAHTLLQKRNGSFWLVLWQEASEYDPSENKDVVLSSKTVTISVGSKFVVSKVYKFDDAGAIRKDEPQDQPDRLELPIDGHLTIIQIDPRSYAESRGHKQP